MRKLILLVLGFGLMSVQKADANINPDSTLGMSGCGCHGGTLQIPRQMAFTLEDPDNNFNAVTSYEPGKTYRIRLRFDSINNAHVVGFVLSALDQPTRSLKAGQLGDPPVLAEPGLTDFVRSADDAAIAAYMDGELPAQVQNVYIDWTAPESNVNVAFSLLRVEANGNNATGGDRGSPSTETTFILGPQSDPSDIEDLEEEENSTDGSTTTKVDPTTSNFSGDFAGGCASIHSANQNPKIDFAYLLAAFAVLLLFVRKRFPLSMKKIARPIE